MPWCLNCGRVRATPTLPSGRNHRAAISTAPDPQLGIRAGRHASSVDRGSSRRHATTAGGCGSLRCRRHGSTAVSKAKVIDAPHIMYPASGRLFLYSRQRILIRSKCALWRINTYFTAPYFNFCNMSAEVKGGMKLDCNSNLIITLALSRMDGCSLGLCRPTAGFLPTTWFIVLTGIT